MSNNFTAKDAAPVTQTFKSTDTAGVHTPHKNVDVIASGASPDIGAVADSAVVTDTTGSLSGKLRGLVKWAFERMPASLGQKAMAASLPVVIADNQSTVEVGQRLAVITPTIVVDTVAYSAGDSIGGKITLANTLRVSGGLATLKMLSVLDRSNQKPEFNLLIFNSDLTAATLTDNAAFVYSTDDLKQIARIRVSTADYETIDSKATATKQLELVLKAASGVDLYAAVVAIASPDFVAGTDFQITLGLEQN